VTVKNKVIFFLKTFITIGLFLFSLRHILIIAGGYAKAKKEGEFSRLGHIMPRSFDDFAQRIQGNREFDENKLQEYVKYYLKIVELFPQKADAYGLLGFCYYHLNHPQEAIEAYRQAIEINPHFFWFHYNLGLIHFKGGHYPEAIETMKNALTKSEKVALVFIRFSKRIYHPILTKRTDDLQSFLRQTFKDAYHHCYRILVLSHYKLQKYQEGAQIAHYAISQDIKEEDKEFFYFYLGLSAYQLKKYKDAVYFFTETINRNANKSEAFYYLGMSVKNLGDEQKAISYLSMSKHLNSVEPTPVEKKEENILLEAF